MKDWVFLALVGGIGLLVGLATRDAYSGFCGSMAAAVLLARPWEKSRV